MAKSPLMQAVDKSNEITAQGVARMSLTVLRTARDEHPKEWDDMMRKQDVGAKIMMLWDYLKSFEYSEKS